MIEENLKKIKSNIPENVQVVVVSKMQPNASILEVYGTGHRVFGENRVQDLTKKQEKLPKDIEWHFIGNLQSNKVKYIAPFIALVHSVDNFRLLKEINKQARNNNRIIDVLIQFHIAEEDTKSGFTFDTAQEMLENEHFQILKNVNIRGVMGMATFTDNKEQVHGEFKTLNSYFQKVKNNYFNAKDDFSIISMGMSGDFEIAIEEGSNMVRIGSAVFK